MSLTFHNLAKACVGVVVAAAVVMTVLLPENNLAVVPLLYMMLYWLDAKHHQLDQSKHHRLRWHLMAE